MTPAKDGRYVTILADADDLTQEEIAAIPF
jgi:hypothetical protein